MPPLPGQALRRILKSERRAQQQQQQQQARGRHAAKREPLTVVQGGDPRIKDRHTDSRALQSSTQWDMRKEHDLAHEGASIFRALYGEPVSGEGGDALGGGRFCCGGITVAGGSAVATCAGALPAK